MRRCCMRVARLLALVSATSCGNDIGEPSSVDGPKPTPDAAILPEMAAGTQIVDTAAVVAGITSDGYVAYYDYDADGHGIAHVVPLAGGSATTIASSVGTGKQDVRFEISGDIVFAWTDRGDMAATMTMWTSATGPIAVGSGMRPGRAAATADNAFVLFESPFVGSGSANVLVGPLAGPWTAVATANSGVTDCWQDTDLVSIGTRLLARFCPGGATNWELHSYAGDGSDDVVLSGPANAATYGSRAVWVDGSNTVHSALADGTEPALLASDAANFQVSDDGSAVAALSLTGAIATMAIDGTGSATTLVAGGAMELGAVSAQARTVLYATMLNGSGSPAPVQPYTNVLAATASGTLTLEPAVTSCPACLTESFTSGGSAVMLLDPIDNSPTAQGEGVLRVVDLGSGATDAMFGTVVYDAVPLPGSGRFMFLSATPDDSLATGWAYGLITRDPIAGDATTFAENAEDFAFDPALGNVAVSFSAGPLTGIWVAPVQ
jgi:hypothetical protein